MRHHKTAREATAVIHAEGVITEIQEKKLLKLQGVRIKALKAEEEAEFLHTPCICMKIVIKDFGKTNFKKQTSMIWMLS